MNITFFRYRNRIKTKILQLKMELADIKREQRIAKSFDTHTQVDLILRKAKINDNINLLKSLL